MGLKRKLYSFIYHKVLGWKSVVEAPNFAKCIICVAPHTTNLDLFMGKLFIGAVGRKSGFLMKKDWFFWPLGYLFKAIGGIPVDRSKRTSLTEQIIEKANKLENFVLAITPEGTRKATTEWKKGFWYIAKGAKLPIILAGIDYQKKIITLAKVFYPSDDIEKDLVEIKAYYTNFVGRHPNKFAV